MNFFNTVISIVLLQAVFAYEVDEFVSTVDQNKEFDICYGEGEGESLRLSDYNGDLNGGNYKVIHIDMAASW